MAGTRISLANEFQRKLFIQRLADAERNAQIGKLSPKDKGFLKEMQDVKEFAEATGWEATITTKQMNYLRSLASE